MSIFAGACQSILRASPRRHLASGLARLTPSQRLFLSTLAVLEQRGGALESASLAAVAAAAKLGGPVTGFLAGASVKAGVAAEAAKVSGLEKVIAVENEAYERVWFSWFSIMGSRSDRRSYC